jgi:hypothetical protein
VIFPGGLLAQARTLQRSRTHARRGGMGPLALCPVHRLP